MNEKIEMPVFTPFHHIKIMLEWPELFHRDIIAEFKRLYRFMPNYRLAELFEICPSTVMRWAKIYGLHHRGKRKILRWGVSKKLIINIENGLFYTEVKAAAISLGLNRSSLGLKLRGIYTNNTNFRLC